MRTIEVHDAVLTRVELHLTFLQPLRLLLQFYEGFLIPLVRQRGNNKIRVVGVRNERGTGAIKPCAVKRLQQRVHTHDEKE